ncbi:MAG: hypothetical protein LBP56_03615 [Odoribacteraceae bacterium]|jgi:hypothetical protein|nr:hypothetical protein [Odoribacteraceae bacterium]
MFIESAVLLFVFPDKLVDPLVAFTIGTPSRLALPTICSGDHCSSSSSLSTFSRMLLVNPRFNR